MRAPAVIAIHGGAGAADANGGQEQWARRATGLGAGLRAGLEVLAAGGAALEAVAIAVAVLEDDEQWNAGRGSALTAAGTVEMDAAVADGRSRKMGGVAVIVGVRHPVHAARAVLEDGRHVLLAGAGATAFARAAGLPFETGEWFVTEARRRELERVAAVTAYRPVFGGSTVGAVARDADGHLAAATSTGGRAGKVPGRVGDSPIPGAGTWADDATCAVSATGDGEAFLRVAFAHEVDARLRLAGGTLEEACQEALGAVTAAGGGGGCIVLGPDGPPVMPFTTPVMYRGWGEVGGPLLVAAGPTAFERIE